MAAYEWSKKFNAEIRGVTLNDQPDASEVGAVLNSIQKKDGGISPEALVKVSKPKRSKTHGMFEWDDTIAGERYRLEQARLAIRSIAVVVHVPENGDKQIRAFSSIKQEEGGRAYVNTVDAMQERETTDALLQDCLNSLLRFRKRWADLAAVAEALKPLDEAVTKLREAVAVS